MPQPSVKPLTELTLGDLWWEVRSLPLSEAMGAVLSGAPLHRALDTTGPLSWTTLSRRLASGPGSAGSLARRAAPGKIALYTLILTPA